MADQDYMNEDTQPSEVESVITPPDLATSGGVKLKATIDALQRALDQRMQMPFNPTMMAMAAGFLKPSQTGGFGESLGAALEGGTKAAELERSRRSEIEKMKMTLALKQYELSQQEEGGKFLDSLMGNQGTPQTTLTQSSAPAGSGADKVAKPALQDVTTEQAVRVVERMPDAMFQMKLTPAIVLAISKKYPPLAKTVQDAFKNQQSMVEIGQKQQDIDIRTKEAEQKEYDMVEVTNPVDPGSTIRVSRKKARELDSIDPRDINAIYRWMASTKQPGFVGKDFSEKAPEGFKPPPTKGERETEEASSKSKAQKRAEESVKQEVSLTDANKNAIPVMQSAENIKSLATSNPKAFDLMQGTDFNDALSRTISQGLNTPWGSVGIDMRPLNEYAKKLKPEDRSAFMMAAQNFAVLQLLASKLQQGQGAVSDYERSLFGELSIGKGDNSTTMRLKAEALAERAKFDQQAYSAYRRFLKKNKDANYEDFVDVESGSEYGKLLEQYNDKIQRMRNANAQLLSGGKAPATPTAPIQRGGSLYQRLKEESQQ